MTRAGVEQRGGARHVIELREVLIQLGRLLHAGAQRDGDAHPEMLRRFDDVTARGMFQQVTVVQRAQPEIFESARVLVIDRRIQLARVRFDELRDALVDQTGVEAETNRLREGVHALAFPPPCR